MDKQYLSSVLCSYFNMLKTKGSSPIEISEKLLILSFLEELLNTDLYIYIEEEDYNIIIQFLNELYGEDCIIPYPDYVELMAKNNSNNITIIKPLNLRVSQNCITRTSSNIIRAASL